MVETPSVDFSSMVPSRRCPGEPHFGQERSNLLLWMHAFGKTAVAPLGWPGQFEWTYLDCSAPVRAMVAPSSAPMLQFAVETFHTLRWRTVLLRSGKQPSNEEVIPPPPPRIGVDQPSPLFPARDVCDDAFRVWRSIPLQGNGSW